MNIAKGNISENNILVLLGESAINTYSNPKRKSKIFHEADAHLGFASYGRGDLRQFRTSDSSRSFHPQGRIAVYLSSGSDTVNEGRVSRLARMNRDMGRSMMWEVPRPPVVLSEARNEDSMIAGVSRVPEAVRQEILDCQMEEGWDLEDADAISAETCRSAIEFLEALLKKNPTMPLPLISPSVFGSITFEWNINGAHVSTRIFPDREIFYMSEEGEGKRSHGNESRQQAITRVLIFLNSHYAQQS